MRWVVFNLLTLSALVSAEGCLIPFDCDDFSRRALYDLLDSIAEVRQDHNARLRVTGIVVNQFQPRANLPRRMVDELCDEGLPVLEPYISASIKVRESDEASRPLPFFARSHKLTAQFEELFDAIEAR